ncbi:MAG: hypothetical protein HC808_00095 [Candidatus Competibacteraceae bacterium]|nr:hypothetical protein [Candidatus Competibacteraceae bacterium]
MAVWANECRRCGDEATIWYVSEMTVAEFPEEVRIVRVKVGTRWRCAMLDRTRRESVEGMLIREVIPTDAASCVECTDQVKGFKRRASSLVDTVSRRDRVF